MPAASRPRPRFTRAGQHRQAETAGAKEARSRRAHVERRQLRSEEEVVGGVRNLLRRAHAALVTGAAGRCHAAVRVETLDVLSVTQRSLPPWETAWSNNQG